MEVVFNINPVGMQGLGPTLTSLVRNCSRSGELVLNFLCADLSADDKRNIQDVLKAEGFEGRLRFIDFDAQKEFGHLRSLHGDYTTYGRLLIPELLSAPRALYLDADLAINLDVLELERSIDLDGHVLAAVTDCTVEWTLDQSFLKDRMGLSKDMPYFNAGVVFFNLDECRKRNATREWRRLADKYSDELVSHDQTVLNAYARGDFVRLPKRFNSLWPATERATPPTDNAIVHFVGSPKPWDLAGRRLHKGHAFWFGYTTDMWRRAYGSRLMTQLVRAWHIRRSMANVLRLMIVGAIGL